MALWFVPILVKAALAYQAAKTAKTVYDYATTDQEKEGRELGIEAAAKLYAPVLNGLKNRQKQIIAETNKVYADAESQKNFLRDKLAYYQRETATYKSKIETIRREHGDDPGVKDFFVALAASVGAASGGAASGGAAIGTGAVLSGNFVRAFSPSVATSALSWLALPAAVVTYILESEMKEKRERFCKEEFEKQALVWQEKIKSYRAEISEWIKNLQFVKGCANYKMKDLNDKVVAAHEEYWGAQADYIVLTERMN